MNLETMVKNKQFVVNQVHNQHGDTRFFHSILRKISRLTSPKSGVGVMFARITNDPPSQPNVLCEFGMANVPNPQVTLNEYTYRKGTEIYGEKEPADYVYQVKIGAVRSYKLLSDGRRQIGAFHLIGDIFGLENGS